MTAEDIREGMYNVIQYVSDKGVADIVGEVEDFLNKVHGGEADAEAIVRATIAVLYIRGWKQPNES